MLPSAAISHLSQRFCLQNSHNLFFFHLQTQDLGLTLKWIVSQYCRIFWEQEFAQESIMQIILHQLDSVVQVKAVSHSLDQNPKHPNTPTTPKQKKTKTKKSKTCLPENGAAAAAATVGR
jgi:hypothetical protein